MNQIVHTFALADFLVGLEGWGSKAGAVARHKLQQRLDLHRGVQLFRISMSGVRRIDVTFASQAIAGLIEADMGTCGICLTELADQDIIANIAAAAQRTQVPVTIWNGDHVQVVGSKLSPSLAEALCVALARPQVRTGELAREAAISITNASTRLKALWALGYLMREERPAPSGGMEHVYHRIG